MFYISSAKLHNKIEKCKFPRKKQKKRTCAFSASGDNPMIHLCFFDHDGLRHATKRNSASAMQSFFDVPHIRVELMIFCVRGRCPGPLDECGSSFFAFNHFLLSKAGAKIRTFLNLTKYFFKLLCKTLYIRTILFNTHTPNARHFAPQRQPNGTNFTPLRPFVRVVSPSHPLRIPFASPSHLLRICVMYAS